jgi:hypothetical protein
MSVSIDTINQTSLVPQTLLGLSSSNQSININSTDGIVFNDATLNQTASLSWTGIITDKPSGFDILSKLNMNSQNIDNVDTLSSTTGNPLTLSSDDTVNIISPTGTYFNTAVPNTGDGIIYGSAHEVSIIDDTAGTGLFYPTFVNGSGTNKDLRIDTFLSFNGTTNTLTCPNITGVASEATAITITDTSSGAGVYFPTFVNTAGTNKSVRTDTSLTYVPTTDTLSATIFNGSASSVSLESDNTNGTYFIPFSKTATATTNKLFIDNITTPLTYNPATGTLTANTLAGSANLLATNTFNVNITCYLTFSNSTAGQGRTIYIDDGTTPLRYNPFYSTLECSFLAGNLVIPTTITGATFSSGLLTLTNPTANPSFSSSYTNSFNYFSITMTGNITTLSLINFRANGEYFVYITGNTIISYTIASSGLGLGIKTNYTIITVPANGTALMRINYDGTTYYVNCSLFS